MKGIYILVILIRKSISIRVGALGKIEFKKGKYAYIGSAQNGIESRVARHLRHEKKKFWHIDYLLDNKNVSVEEVWYKEAPKDEECKVAGMLAGKDAYPTIPGFGCSDCKCVSHLFILGKDSRIVEWSDGWMVKMVK